MFLQETSCLQVEAVGLPMANTSPLSSWAVSPLSANLRALAARISHAISEDLA